jgi:carbon-monoxide dehydrogenase medium subunit
LIACGAVAVIAGPGGSRREAPLDGFFTDYFTVALEPGELITGVRVPPADGAKATYLKFLPRTADDYATVSVAAVVRKDDAGRITSARIVLGAVGPTPIRATAVEQALIGRMPGARDIADAAELVRDQVDPIGDARGSRPYKIEMARVWTERALAEVVA